VKIYASAFPVGHASAFLIAATRGTRLVDLVTRDLQPQVQFAERGGFNGVIGKAVAFSNDDESITVVYGASMPEGQEFREWDRDPVINWCRGLAHGIREARHHGVTDIAIQGITPVNAMLAGYYAESANYDFDCGQLRRPKEWGTPGAAIRNICVHDGHEWFLERGVAIGRARNFGRDLMNRPSSALTTTALADAALEVANESRGAITATVLEREEMESDGFDLTLAISAGSNPLKNPPKVVILEYFGDPRGREAKGVMLVGKGVVHDLGGNNIKADCRDMHMDMGGAATMIATMQAVAALGLKVNVRMIVFCVQNAVGPDMTISGTPIFSRLLNKTVVDINTDAEGRLGLAEAIAYAKKMWGGWIALGFDAATLTGLQALFFPEMSTAWGNQGDIAWAAHKASLEVGDRVAVGFMDHGCLADLQKAGGLYEMGNIGTRKGAGGITLGGSTLGCEFALQAIGGEIPWCHVDMAGAMERSADAGEFAKGGDVPNVITLVGILQNLPGFLKRAGIASEPSVQ
jgi:leucyl aminopeptidase